MENREGDRSTCILSLFCEGASRGKTHSMTDSSVKIKNRYLKSCKNLGNEVEKTLVFFLLLFLFFCFFTV